MKPQPPTSAAMGKKLSPPPHAEDAPLTSQEAADILNVSKPYIAKLIGEGRLHVAEAATPDDHRVAKDDVMRVRDEMRAVTNAGLDAIANIGGKEDRTPLKSRWVKTSTKK